METLKPSPSNHRVIICKTAINSAMNDDCLVEVFKRMKVPELIHLCRFCDHCLHLIKTRIFTERNIDFAELKGQYDVQQVLADFGGSKLTIHRQDIRRINHEITDSEELLQLLDKHCDPDVLKQLDITVNFNDIDRSNIDRFSEKLRKLHELSITASHYGSRHRKLNHLENNQRIETLLQNSVDIEKLHLKHLPISAAFLQKTSLHHLTELSIVQCDQIQSEALINSACHLTNLTHFKWINSKFEDISKISDNIEMLCNILGREFIQLSHVTVHMNYGLNYCHRSDGSVLNGLCSLLNLESLSIGIGGACACNDFYGCIRQLGHLKHLAIESPVIFAGRQCLPCKRITSNYLPKLFKYLADLNGLRIVNVNQDNEDLLDVIATQLPRIQELHLNGYRKMNADKLLEAVRKLPILTMLNVQATKFHFSSRLYSQLVDECIQKKRFLKVIVGREMKRALFTEITYRKEFVQILD